MSQLDQCTWQDLVDRARALAQDLTVDDGTNDLTASDLNQHRLHILNGMCDRRFDSGYDQSEYDVLLRASDAWFDRRRSHKNAQAMRQAAEKRAAARQRWRLVSVGGVDVTEHVAAMFDALVASMDWGSDFLDDDTIHSILTVADLVSLDVPSDDRRVVRWRQQHRARIVAEAASAETAHDAGEGRGQ